MLIRASASSSGRTASGSLIPKTRPQTERLRVRFFSSVAQT